MPNKSPGQANDQAKDTDDATPAAGPAAGPGDLRSRNLPPEEIRAAAAALGSIRSPKKEAASRRNGQMYGGGEGRPPRPLMEYPCTCGRGAVLDTSHPTTCPRGRAIRRRLDKGKPLA